MCAAQSTLTVAFMALVAVQQPLQSAATRAAAAPAAGAAHAPTSKGTAKGRFTACAAHPEQRTTGLTFAGRQCKQL